MLLLEWYRFSLMMYICLLDLGSTLYSVTPYIDMFFCFDKNNIFYSFSISTLVEDLILDKRFYKGCVVSVSGRQTSADLF